MKVKEGKTQFDMAKTTTQGGKIHMADGYNHMLKYLNERHYDLIGPHGLEMWANKFPKYAKAIPHKIATDKLWWMKKKNCTLWKHCAVWFGPGLDRVQAVNMLRN